MLVITTPATSRLLLTTDEIRSACGVTGSAQDTALATLNARVASAITRGCGVASGGTTPPTLREETLTETFREVCGATYLRLSRFPVVSITSVTVDGTARDDADYEVSGRNLYPLTSDARTYWSATKIVVVYVAGWAEVPDDLKTAAAKLARIFWAEDGPNARSDPNLKSIQIEGVGRRDFWVAPASDPLMSQEIQELLLPYRDWPV